MVDMEQATDASEVVEAGKRVVRDFGAACLWHARPFDVTMAVHRTTLGDIAFLDPAGAKVVEAAYRIAHRRVSPSPQAVFAELLETGVFSGSDERLVKQRLTVMTSPSGYPERLPELAAQVEALVFRSRVESYGRALVEGAHRMAEHDLTEMLGQGRAGLLEVWQRLSVLRTDQGWSPEKASPEVAVMEEQVA